MGVHSFCLVDKIRQFVEAFQSSPILLTSAWSVWWFLLLSQQLLVWEITLKTQKWSNLFSFVDFYLILFFFFSLVGSVYQRITECTYSNLYLYRQCGKRTFNVSMKGFFPMKVLNILLGQYFVSSSIWNSTVLYENAVWPLYIFKILCDLFVWPS